MKKSLVIVVVALMLLAGMQVSAAEPIVVGAIVDLSAATALWGQSQARGIEMAIEEYNAA
ncbi:MAG TPA: amino acid ABC transporter, partial [Firmicutes bacterium]|nr:amino acid ABC transporter [Bacillota bacterium]